MSSQDAGTTFPRWSPLPCCHGAAYLEGRVSGSCRLTGDALLHSSLNTLNAAVLSDARQGRKQQQEGDDSLQRPGSPVTPLEPDLAQLLASAGQTNAMEKVFWHLMPSVSYKVAGHFLYWSIPPSMSSILHSACLF